MTCGSPGPGGARVFVDQAAQDGFPADPFSVGAGCPAGSSRQRSGPACRARRRSRARCGTPARLSRAVGRGPQVTLIPDLVPSPARAAGVHARSVAGIRQAGPRSAGTGLAPGGPASAASVLSPRGEGNLMNHNAGWALQRSLPGRHNGRRVRRRVPRGYTRGPRSGYERDLLRSGRRPDEPSQRWSKRCGEPLAPP